MKALIYLIIFLLPWQTRYIWHEGSLGVASGISEYSTFSLYGIDLLIVILFAVFLYKVISNKLNSKSNKALFSGIVIKSRWHKYILLSILSLVIISFVSIFLAEDSMVALMRFITFIEGIALAMIILVEPSISIRHIYRLFIASALIQAVIGFVQFGVQWQFSNKWLGLSELNPAALGISVVEYSTYVADLGGIFGHRWLRAYGSLPHPNILGGFLLTGLLFSIILYIKNRQNKYKLSVLLILLTIVPGFLVSFSRSAWLGFIIASFIIVFILFYEYLKAKIQDKKIRIMDFSVFQSIKVFVFIGLICSVIIISYTDLFKTRVLAQQRLELRSSQERLSSIKESSEIIGKNWYKGVGIGNYTHVLAKNYERQWTYEYQPVHNVFLMVFAEIGIFGLFAYLILIFSIFRIYIINLKEVARNPLKLGILAVFIGFLAISLFDHYFWTLHIGVILWWLIIGLSMRQLFRE